MTLVPGAFSSLENPMRAKMDVEFDSGAVRIRGNKQSMSVELLDNNYDPASVVVTQRTQKLRELARAINLVADFIEGEE